MDTTELVHISDLATKVHSIKIQVRIVRVWAATPPDGALIWYYGTLLVDALGSVIEARVPIEQYQRLSSLIEEGRICEIAKFSVMPAPKKYHVVEGSRIISFTDQTTIIPLSSFRIQIPVRYFNFQRIDAVGNQIKDKDKIIDVIGRIAGFGRVKQTSQSKPYQIMYLADERGCMVQLTLWSQYLHMFDTAALHEQSRTHPVIVACAAVQINEWRRVYGLKAISGTRFYFDVTIPEIEQFAASLPPNLPSIVLDTEGPPYDGTPVPDRTQQITYLEPQTLTVSEFLAVPVNVHSNTLYKCIVSIYDVNNRYDWHYRACKKCWSKLKNQFCERCAMHRNDYIEWYKILLAVRDDTGIVEMTALGRIAKLITGVDVNDMIRIHESTKSDVPGPLLDVIGKTYQFTVLPKEVPNYPGIRRNTITRVDPVPPTAGPILAIEQGNEIPHSTEKTIEIGTQESSSRNLNRSEEAPLQLMICAASATTPPNMLDHDESITSPDKKGKRPAHEQPSQIVHPPVRRKLFTEPDLEEHESKCEAPDNNAVEAQNKCPTAPDKPKNEQSPNRTSTVPGQMTKSSSDVN